MCNILCVIFQTVVLIFIVVSCNKTFQPLYQFQEGWRVQVPKRSVTTNNNKEEEKSKTKITQKILHE